MKNICLVIALSAFCLLNAQDLSAQTADYKIPAAFSPNGDEKNDGFRPVFSDEAPESYVFLVFAADGKVMFRTKNPEQDWTGMNLKSGVEAPNGVYTWKLNFMENGVRVEDEGQVTLMR